MQIEKVDNGIIVDPDIPGQAKTIFETEDDDGLNYQRIRYFSLRLSNILAGLDLVMTKNVSIYR